MKPIATPRLALDAALQRLIAKAQGTGHLTNVQSNDPLKCRVGESGPNCHAVWQAYRLTRDVAAASRDLEIQPEAAIEALAYYSLHPVVRSAEELEWEALGLASLFSANDAIPTEE